MKISIAVPSYNYHKFISVCLESILMQDYQNYEVLIADGGSTDGTMEIIYKFCEKDSRFKLISTSDNGQPDAIVKAFGCASGDIFCFLNADDHYLCRDVFSNVVKNFTNFTSIDILSLGGYYTDAEGKYIKQVHYHYHPLDSIANMRYRTAVLQPGTFWKKEVYIKNPFKLDFHYSFDSVFFYESYQNFIWLELAYPVSGYRLHGVNKSMQIIPKRIFEIARFEQLKFGQFSLRALYLRIIGVIISVLIRVPVLGKLLCQFVYKIVNTISFITVYRLPGI